MITLLAGPDRIDRKSIGAAQPFGSTSFRRLEPSSGEFLTTADIPVENLLLLNSDIEVSL